MAGSAVSVTALAAVLAAVGSTNQSPPPVRLIAEPHGPGVTIRVVGDAAAPVDASYMLQVASDSRSGTNRSTQSGTARLQPGAPVTLVTMNLGRVPGGAWSARLTVRTPQGDYELRDGSAKP